MYSTGKTSRFMTDFSRYIFRLKSTEVVSVVKKFVDRNQFVEVRRIVTDQFRSVLKFEKKCLKSVTGKLEFGR